MRHGGVNKAKNKSAEEGVRVRLDCLQRAANGVKANALKVSR